MVVVPFITDLIKHGKATGTITPIEKLESVTFHYIVTITFLQSIVYDKEAQKEVFYPRISFGQDFDCNISKSILNKYRHNEEELDAKIKDYIRNSSKCKEFIKEMEDKCPNREYTISMYKTYEDINTSTVQSISLDIDF